MANSLRKRTYNRLLQCWAVASALVWRLSMPFSCFYSRWFIREAASDRMTTIKNAGPCRFRLDTATSSAFDLPDGRLLGYAQYGSESGHPIFYLHGSPGSRLDGAGIDSMATSVDARIIAVERPGIGWSSPQPGRTLQDHAKDVQYLAEHLGLHEYGVMGVSAGGPYALACAYALPPAKLKAAAIICGLGPPDMPRTGLSWLSWAFSTFGWQYFPGLIKHMLRSSIITKLDLSDEKRLEILLKEAAASVGHPKDASVFKDIDRMRLFLRSTREAFRQGLEPHEQEGKLISTDFGFRIENIRSDLPIQLWYGRFDANVPPCHGEQTALRLGDHASLSLEDETHSSLAICKEEILAKLVMSMK